MTRVIDILLIEHDPGEQRLFREALLKANRFNRLHITPDGPSSLRFLRRQGSYHVSPRPQMILLDLDLPKDEARELLRVIKADPKLQTIPVLVFGSSATEDQVASCYALHANAYFTKSTELEEFFASVKALDLFWRSVLLPQ